MWSPLHVPRHTTISEKMRESLSSRSDEKGKKQKKTARKESNDRDENKKEKFLCGICFDYKEYTDMFKRNKSKCNHPFCADCISKHVAAQIRQNILKVNCPNPNCSFELKPARLKSILPREVVDRWETARCESSIEVREKTYCPFNDCSILLVNDVDEGQVVTSAECPYCHRLFCARCKVPWHARMSCRKFQKYLTSNEDKDSEKKFLDLAKRKKWQKCPKCNFYVQRSSGCEHMKCRCGCNFCYHCGKDWKHGHICGDW